VRDYGDAVIARVQFSGHARASGVVSPWRAFSVFWLRDGLITRIEDYADRAEALKAVGLEE
jgi:ketosteroid isomerase-like protein